jgi:hypothetical protein
MPNDDARPVQVHRGERCRPVCGHIATVPQRQRALLGESPGELGEIMSVREQGMRRAAALTTALAVVGVAGSVALATVAKANTPSAAPTSSPSSTGSATTPSGPSLTTDNGRSPHATSGGS